MKKKVFCWVRPCIGQNERVWSGRCQHVLAPRGGAVSLADERHGVGAKIGSL